MRLLLGSALASGNRWWSLWYVFITVSDNLLGWRPFSTYAPTNSSFANEFSLWTLRSGSRRVWHFWQAMIDKIYEEEHISSWDWEADVTTYISVARNLDILWQAQRQGRVVRRYYIGLFEGFAMSVELRLCKSCREAWFWFDWLVQSLLDTGIHMLKDCCCTLLLN